MRISKSGNFAVIDTGVGVFTASISAADRTPFSGVQPYLADTGTSPLRIGDFQIVPFGAANDLPGDFRKILDDNHITAELLTKKTDLLWAQGPDTYTIKKEKGKRVKIWMDDKDVNAWLKDWDWEDYLMKATVETRHINGHFTKYFRNRAPRIGGKGFITHLKHISSTDARLEWPENGEVKHIITGNFSKPWKKGLKQYPIFNHRDPFGFRVSMHYSNLYTFALDNSYSLPSIYGLFNWIKLSSSLPVLLMNFNINSAAIRYHIKSPAIYWNMKEDKLKENCKLQNIEYKDEMLEDLKDSIYLKFAEGLIGIEKAGKMITTETIYDELGQEYVSWEVDTIDQKVKNYISAQIEIAKRSDFEITAGIGLHPALSNMSADGNLPSGSEQLYAYKLYQQTSVEIPENIVCRDINYALAANFPNNNVKIGFYKDTVLTEEMTTPSQRIKNK